MSSVGNRSDEDSQPSSGEASPSAVDTITLPAVKGYITDHGGRVKHTDIVNHFRRQLSDPVAKGSDVYLLKARLEIRLGLLSCPCHLINVHPTPLLFDNG